MSDKEKSPEERVLAARNMRLVIILGLLALGFYGGFILVYI